MDDLVCTDIDECADGSNGGCAHVCTNTDGSYECSCNAGYVLNADGHACDDVDECTAGTDGCAHDCTNTIGSYTCSCMEGYILAADGHDCEPEPTGAMPTVMPTDDPLV
ncbi:hypothetical protein ACR2WA_25390 [Klebsiella pneumoniae]